MPWSATDVAPQLTKEVAVLEISQQAQVNQQAQCHQALAPQLRPCGVDDVGYQIVGARHHSKQEEINATALVVEIVTEREHKNGAQHRPLAKQRVDDNENREHAQEHATRENERRVLVVGELLEQQPPV